MVQELTKWKHYKRVSRLISHNIVVVGDNKNRPDLGPVSASNDFDQQAKEPAVAKQFLYTTVVIKWLE